MLAEVTRRLTAVWRRRRAYRAVFATPAGEDVMADMMRWARVFEECHVPGDPVSTAYQLGQRRAVLRMAKLARISEAELQRIEYDAEQEDHVHAA